MRNMLDYKIINKYSNIRRNNRKDFVLNISGKKKKNIAILAIYFNNPENTKRLLEYLKKEKNQNFDIILVDNATKIDLEKDFYDLVSKFENTTIIKPVSNLGSAGGYALGMEYIINQQYEYFFMIEDDVILIEDNVFSDLIECANDKTLTFINNCKNTRETKDTKNKGKSRWVQLAGYPVNFVEKIGIIDPRYFFRAEDLEWGSRIEKGIKKLGYKTKVVDKNYLHPYLKSVNGNYTWFYFSMRNQLLSLEKSPKNNYQFFIVLFFYLRTAITKLLVKRDNLILKSFKDAISDFLNRNFSRANNKNKIGGFINQNKKEEKVELIDKTELSVYSKNLYSSDKILLITGVDREGIKYSSSIKDLWENGILISSSSTIFYPISLLAKRVICINEFDLGGDKVFIIRYENGNIVMNLVWIMTSFIVSLALIIMVNFVIILSIGFNKWFLKKR